MIILIEALNQASEARIVFYGVVAVLIVAIIMDGLVKIAQIFSKKNKDPLLAQVVAKMLKGDAAW